MKYILALILLTCFYTHIYSQEISNIILINKDNEVVDNIKKAKAFIVVKRFDSSFQRLDYGVHAPLQLLRTYKGSDMKILEGRYIRYRESGWIQEWGNYTDNLKEGDWYFYNDTGKVYKRIKYLKGTELETENYDLNEKEDTTTSPGDFEAEFPGGQKALVQYLIKTIDPDVAESTKKGGKIRVLFTVEKITGKIYDIYLQKSAEFVLDEEGIRVVKLMPNWKPGLDKGKPVNAYRVQPLTFAKQ